MVAFWHHHAGVSVPDLNASIAWYEGVLGFTLERRRILESVPCEMAMMRNGDLRIELFEVPGATPPREDRSMPDSDLRTYGNKHISFAVDDISVVAEVLRARGADIVWVKVFPFGANIFLRDQAGNLIEFVQAPRLHSTIAQL